MARFPDRWQATQQHCVRTSASQVEEWSTSRSRQFVAVVCWLNVASVLKMSTPAGLQHFLPVGTRGVLFLTSVFKNTVYRSSIFNSVSAPVPAQVIIDDFTFTVN
jgi:hypothetical protein